MRQASEKGKQVFKEKISSKLNKWISNGAWVFDKIQMRSNFKQQEHNQKFNNNWNWK